MKPITVVSVDDHYLLRSGIRGEIEKDSGLVMVGEGVCGADVFDLVEQHKPNVLLLDIKMAQDANNPGAGKFQVLPALRVIKRMSPHTAIMILSAEVSHTLVEVAFSKGLDAYLLKGDEATQSLPEAIRYVHSGGVLFSKTLQNKMTRTDSYLDGDIITKRQKQIILAIAEQPNLSYAAHATNFGITEGALKNRLTDLFKRLGVNNIKECIVECIRREIITVSNE